MRLIVQSFKLAFKSIVSNKMRSFLTMLGMIIGVASVIILTGLVNGVTNYIVDSFADMGTNMLSVTVTNSGTRKVSVDEMYKLAEDNTEVIEGVSPKITGSYTLKSDSASLTRKTVTGVGENYHELSHIGINTGRFISYADIVTRNKVCVIGTYTADALFFDSEDGSASGITSLFADYSTLIGENVKIDGDVYTIVGILDEQEDSTENSSDDCVYIPYSNAARLTWTATVDSFIFAANETEDIEQAEEILDTALYDIYKDESMYKITSMTALLDTVESMTGILTAILSGIAGISLLVAGIGIMNIMLVSVVERTKEIGIRKALGAKRSDILWQFVVEAGSISSFGGILGIAAGSGAVVALGRVFGVEASPTTGSIVLSFCVSAGIGIFFGYMPARRAAKLNPIDALRNE